MMDLESLTPWIPVIQAILQAAGFIFAAALVVWQLGRQHRNAIAENRDQIREQLRVEIYRDINPKITAAAMILSKEGTRCWITVRALEFRRRRLDQTGVALEPLYTPSEGELDSLHYEALDRLLEVMWVLEGYEIAFPGFDPFKRRFSEAHEKLSNSFNALKTKLDPLLPADHPKGEQGGQYRVLPAPPNEQTVAELDELVHSLQQVAYDVQGYLFDLRVAAQNHLMAGVFPGHTVKERQPLDPRFEVLRPQEKKK